MPAVYLETRDIPLNQLRPFPGNAKRGNIAEIRASLRKHGQYRALIVRQHDDGLLTILAGNNTREALAAEGQQVARCEIVQCTDDEANRINVADNRLGEIGEYDVKALARQLAALDDDLSGVGYSDGEIEGILRAGDFYGDQATAFLDDYTAPPVAPGALDGFPDSPPPAQPPAPPPAVPAAAPEPTEQPATPAGPLPPSSPPPAAPQYVTLSWTCDVPQRDTVRSALKLAQGRMQLSTSTEALVAVCRRYLDEEGTTA